VNVRGIHPGSSAIEERRDCFVGVCDCLVLSLVLFRACRRILSQGLVGNVYIEGQSQGNSAHVLCILIANREDGRITSFRLVLAICFVVASVDCIADNWMSFWRMLRSGCVV
jgi:hypothetical protein